MFEYKHFGKYFEDLMLYDVSFYVNEVVRVGNISKTVSKVVLKSKCRLSFNSSNVKDEGLSSNSVVLATLFVPCDVVVKEGVKAVVSQLGVKYSFVVGKLKPYITHNEYEIREFIKRV